MVPATDVISVLGSCAREFSFLVHKCGWCGATFSELFFIVYRRALFFSKKGCMIYRYIRKVSYSIMWAQSVGEELKNRWNAFPGMAPFGDD